MALSANAGVDQTINDATVLTLVGTVTQGVAPITHQIWTKTSGPDCAMTAASSLINQVYELSVGTYVFTLTVYDQLHASASDTVQVVVSHTSGPLFIPQGNSDTVFDWFPQIDYSVAPGANTN